MRVRLVAVALASSVIGLWPGGASDAQDGLTRRDAQGPVTVVVTLMPPTAPGDPIKAKVVLDTHSVALDGVAFQDAVAMRSPDGTEVRPRAVEQASGGGHHREAVLVFPPVPQAGAVRIVVRNVGGVPERTFAWDLVPR
jgi:hypothetical protein